MKLWKAGLWIFMNKTLTRVKSDHQQPHEKFRALLNAIIVSDMCSEHSPPSF